MSLAALLQTAHIQLPKLWPALGQMDGPSWYLVVVGFLLVTYLFLSGMYQVLRMLLAWCLPLAFKHLISPRIMTRVPLVGTVTRFEALLAFLYLLANTLLVAIGTGVARRAATLSIINLLPLLCGPRLSLVARLFGVSLSTMTWSHQWFGRVSLAQALVHTVISLTGSVAFSWTTANVFGVTVGPARSPVAEMLIPETDQLRARPHVPLVDEVCQDRRVRMVPQLPHLTLCRSRSRKLGPCPGRDDRRSRPPHRSMSLGWCQRRPLVAFRVQEPVVWQAAG